MTYEGRKSAVDGSGWVDLVAWTGRHWAQLPMEIRESGDTITHCASIVAAVGDPACDPRSGGVAGMANLAASFGVTATHFRKHILPTLGYVRRLANVPITNVASLAADAVDYRERVRRERCGRLGV